jgi:DNA polymerase III delta subunit
MAAKSKTGAFETTAESYIKNLKKLADSRSNPEARFSTGELENYSLYLPVVIKGGEAFRAKRIVGLSNEILFSKNPEKQVRNYFASDLTNQNVINSLLAESKGGALFSRASCVALYDTESLKIAALDKLVSLLSLKVSEIFFIIVAGEKSNKLLDALEGRFLNVALSELQGEQLAKWSLKELERQGHKGGIEPAAIDLLVRSFGEDSTRLMTELSKLALLVSQDKLIKKRDVEELLLQNEEQNTFSLLECIAEKKPAAALKVFQGLTAQGQHPLQILALVSKSIRSLIATGGKSNTKLHADISNPWILRNVPKSKRLFSQKDLTLSLELVARLDDQLKGSKRVPEELVEDLIVKLAGR